MAVVIPITGFLIRRIRTRVLFGLAMALFSAGTLLAALAPVFGVLLTARVVQATGTAIMMPLLMTTVMKLVPPQRRGAVMGNIATVISVAPAIGPAISGFVLHSLGWRFMFWLVLPIALAALVFGILRMVDVGEPEHVRDRPAVGDPVGLRVRRARLRPEQPRPRRRCRWLPAWVPIVVGVVVLALFVARQLQLQRTDSALLDLRTFLAGGFTIASLLMMLMMTTLFGAIILLPIYMQTVMGLDTQTAGLVLLPGGLVMGLLGPFVGRLYDRFGARPLLVPGMVVTSLALWSTTLFTSQTGIPLLMTLPHAAVDGPRVRVHPAVHLRSGLGRAEVLLLRQRDLRHHPAAGRRGRGGPAGQHHDRAAELAGRRRRGARGGHRRAASTRRSSWPRACRWSGSSARSSSARPTRPRARRPATDEAHHARDGRGGASAGAEPR